MVDWDSIATSNDDRDLIKERLGLDSLDTKLDEIKTKTTLLDDIKDKTELIDGLKTKIEALEKKKTEELINSKTKGRSVWFALGAIGAIMTGTVLSNDPITLLENVSFQTIIGALVTYATGRQIFKQATKT